MSNSIRAAEIPSASTNLLQLASMHDESSWQRLVSIFGPIVYRWCRSSGVAPADVPDIVQEVFASVARNLGRFERRRETGSFRSWLATVTRSRVRDHFRREEKRFRATGGTQAMEQIRELSESLESTICEATIDNALLAEALKIVRNEFSDVTWQAFWQTAVECRLARDVAEALSISTALVYQSKSRVLRRLREQMSKLP